MFSLRELLLIFMISILFISCKSTGPRSEEEKLEDEIFGENIKFNQCSFSYIDSDCSNDIPESFNLICISSANSEEIESCNCILSYNSIISMPDFESGIYTIKTISIDDCQINNFSESKVNIID